MSLLILRPGAIGDTLLTFPILQHLRTSAPASALTFVGNATVLPLIQTFQLASETASYENPLWSQLFLPPNHPKQQPLLKKLQHIDRAICWLSDPDDRISQNLQVAGISQITMAPGRPAANRSLPLMDYLAQSIGEVPGELTPWHAPSTYAWQRTDEETDKSTRAIAIHPGSGGIAKCWPISHFAHVITELWQQRIPVLLLAGPAEQERLQILLQLLPAPPQPTLLRLLVEQPLLTVAQKLRQCRSYLGNDSGLTHLAALLGVPTLALFGPSDPRIWQPLGPNVTILHNPSMVDIVPHTVLAHLYRSAG